MPRIDLTRPCRRSRPVMAVLATLLAAAAALAQAGDPFAPGSPTPPAPTPKPATPSTPPAQPAPGQVATPVDTTPPPGQPGGQQIDLRPKYRAGEQMRYVMQLDSRNRVKPITPAKDPAEDEDITSDQQQNTRLGLLVRVVQSGPEGAKLQVVYESIRLSLDLPGGRAEFDSTRPTTPASPSTNPSTKPTPRPKPVPARSPSPASTPPGAPAQPAVDEDMSKLLEQLISPMIGTTLELTTDPSGNITTVTGGDALSGAGAFADLLKGLTQGAGGAGGGNAMPGVGGLAGLPGMPGTTPSGGNWLSGSSGSAGLRRVGESWTNTDALGSTPAGPMNMVTTHTLRSASGSTATVTFQGRATGTGSAAGSKSQVEGSQYAGQYVWDTRAGQLQTMQSEMSTSTTGQIGTRPVRMSSQTTINVRRQ